MSNISIPAWLLQAVSDMASEEQTTVDQIAFDALVEHIRAVAPHFMPGDAPFRNERNMTIRLVSHILRDAISNSADVIALVSEGDKFVVKHHKQNQWQIMHAYPVAWLRPISSRLAFMSMGSSKIKVESRNQEYTFSFQDLMPDKILLGSEHHTDK